VLLLGWSWVNGPVGVLASKLGGIAGVPGIAFIVLTLLLPGLLALLAARVFRAPPA
jgi:hypothetical protein